MGRDRLHVCDGRARRPGVNRPTRRRRRPCSRDQGACPPRCAVLRLLARYAHPRPLPVGVAFGGGRHGRGRRPGRVRRPVQPWSRGRCGRSRGGSDGDRVGSEPKRVQAVKRDAFALGWLIGLVNGALIVCCCFALAMCAGCVSSSGEPASTPRPAGFVYVCADDSHAVELCWYASAGSLADSLGDHLGGAWSCRFSTRTAECLYHCSGGRGCNALGSQETGSCWCPDGAL